MLHIPGRFWKRYIGAIQWLAINKVTYIENEDLEHKGEEDVPRLPHDAHLARLLNLQGDCEQQLG